MAEEVFHGGEVGLTEPLPFGDQQHGIGALQGVVLVLGHDDAPIGNPLWIQFGGRFLHGDGIVCRYRRARFDQPTDHHQRCCLPYIVGVGLERQAPHREMTPAQVLAEVSADLLQKHLLLGLVARIHSTQQGGIEIDFLAHADQRTDVFGEARATVTAPGIKEGVADTLVGADTLAHVLDVSAQAVAQVRHLVHERDTRREHGVGCVLGHLRVAHTHQHQSVVVAQEGLVELRHHPTGLFRVGAHHNTVRAAEVIHRRAFLQELGVADDIELDLHAPGVEFGADRSTHLVGGTHGNGGFVDHHRVLLEVLPDIACYRKHITQISRTVLAGRCAHGNEDVFGSGHGSSDIACEREQTTLHRLLHQGLEARLEDGDIACLQTRELALVVIDTGNMVTHLGETGARYQADVSGADHSNAHGLPSLMAARGAEFSSISLPFGDHADTPRRG